MLHDLLPSKKERRYESRSNKAYVLLKVRTDRFKDSLCHIAYSYIMLCIWCDIYVICNQVSSVQIKWVINISMILMKCLVPCSNVLFLVTCFYHCTVFNPLIANKLLKYHKYKTKLWSNPPNYLVKLTNQRASTEMDIRSLICHLTYLNRC